MAEGNFFDLYFSSSDSNGEFEEFESENSFIIMLSLVTICTMICKWFIINQGMSLLGGILLRRGFLILESENLFIYLLRTFCPHLGSFLLFFSLRFGQISPLAFFRWLTATSDKNAESCNRIPSNYCLP